MLVRALYLGVRRNVASVARYPLGLVNLTVLGPLYRLILPSFLLGSAFLVHGQAAGLLHTTGTGSYQGFLFLGACMNVLLVGTLIASSAIFGIERAVGTLEQSWTAPVSRARLSLETVLSGMAIAAFGAAACLGVGVAAFGVGLRPAVAAAIPAVLIGAAGIAGLAFVMLALQLWLRQVRAALDGVGIAFGLLSGNVFPVLVLPAPLLAISRLLPTTYGIDLLRHYGLGTRTLAAPAVEYGLESVCAAGLVAAGLFAFRWAVRRSLITGDAGQY